MRDPQAVLQLVDRPEIAGIAGEARTRLERVLPWARRRYRSRREDRSCDRVDRARVWCRCGGAAGSGDLAAQNP